MFKRRFQNHIHTSMLIIGISVISSDMAMGNTMRNLMLVVYFYAEESIIDNKALVLVSNNTW